MAPTIQDLLVHAPFVRAIARAAVRGDAQVDDVVQATWLAALEKGPRHAGAPRGWLATVARNAARSMGRGESRRSTREHRAARRERVPSTAAIAEREETRRRLLEAVLALDEPYRAAVLLRYYEDLPPREVAARLDIPVETVRTRVKRGLHKLRDRLDEQHGGDRRAWAVGVPGLVEAGAAASAAVGATAGWGLFKIAFATGALLVGAFGVSQWLSDDAASGVAKPDEAVAQGGGPILQPIGPAGAQGYRGAGRITGEIKRSDNESDVRIDVYRHGTIADLFAYWSLRAPTPKSKVIRSVVPAPDGTFEVPGLADGVYQLWAVAADGHTAITSAVVGIEPGASEAEIDLRRGPHVFAGVATYADGRPFRGWIRLSTGNRGVAMLWLPFGPPAVHTDAEGRFRFERLAEPLATLIALDPGRFASLRLKVMATDRIAFEVDPEAAPVRGRVEDADGQPVVGADVTALSRSEQGYAFVKARTDATGAFVRAVPFPHRTLLVQANGFVDTMHEVKSLDEAVVVRPVREARIRGRVVSGDGEPRAGVAIHAHPLERDRGPQIAQRLRASADDGTFDIGVPPGAVWVAAYGNGWMSAKIHEISKAFNPYVVDTSPGGTQSIDLVVVPTPRAVGVVTDAQGAPLSGVRVRGPRAKLDAVRGPMRLPQPATRTDEAGRYELTTVWPSTACRIEAHSRLHGTTRAAPYRSVPGKTETVDFAMAAPRQVVVRVVDEDNAPVPGAQISIWTDTGTGWRARAAGVTDDQGALTVGPLRQEDRSLSIQGGPGLVKDEDRTPIRAGAQTMRLVAERGRTLRGRVRAEGIDVSGTSIDVKTGRRFRSSVRAGKDGRFQFDGVPARDGVILARQTIDGRTWFGRTTLRADDRDVAVTLSVAPNPQRVRKGEHFTLRILGLAGERVARASMYSRGTPPDGDPMWLGGGTNREVPFKLSIQERFRDQRYSLFGFRDARGTLLPYGAIDVGRRPAGGERTVQLAPEQFVEGIVVDADGKPVRGVLVVARPYFVGFPKAGHAHGEVRTDAKGRFRVGGLGDFVYRMEVLSDRTYASLAPIVATGGNRGVRIELARAKDIVLTVHDHTGRPVRRAQVRASVAGAPSSREGGPMEITGTTDGLGQVVLRGLAPTQSYRLAIRTMGDVSEVLPLVRETWAPQDETIVMPRGYLIEGVVRASDGGPIAEATVYRETGPSGWQGVRVASDGRFRIGNLAPGRYRLKASLAGNHNIHAPDYPSVHVDAGDTDVSITVDRGEQIVVDVGVHGKASTRIMVMEEPTDPSFVHAAWHRQPTDGRAVFESLRSDRTYAVWVTGLRDARVFYRPGVPSGSTVTVQPVEGETIRVRVRLAGPAPEGFTWKGVSVGAHGSNQTWRVHQTHKLAKEGVVELRGLPETPCVVWALAARHKDHEVVWTLHAQKTINELGDVELVLRKP